MRILLAYHFRDILLHFTTVRPILKKFLAWQIEYVVLNKSSLYRSNFSICTAEASTFLLLLSLLSASNFSSYFIKTFNDNKITLSKLIPFDCTNMDLVPFNVYAIYDSKMIIRRCIKRVQKKICVFYKFRTMIGRSISCTLTCIYSYIFLLPFSISYEPYIVEY